MCKLIQFPIQFSIEPEEELEMYSEEEIDEQYGDYYGYEDELYRENCQREEERIRKQLEKYDQKESCLGKLIKKVFA